MFIIDLYSFLCDRPLHALSYSLMMGNVQRSCAKSLAAKTKRLWNQYLHQYFPYWQDDNPRCEIEVESSPTCSGGRNSDIRMRTVLLQLDQRFSFYD